MGLWCHNPGLLPDLHPVPKFPLPFLWKTPEGDLAAPNPLEILTGIGLWQTVSYSHLVSDLA